MAGTVAGTSHHLELGRLLLGFSAHQQPQAPLWRERHEMVWAKAGKCGVRTGKPKHTKIFGLRITLLYSLILFLTLEARLPKPGFNSGLH